MRNVELHTWECPEQEWNIEGSPIKSDQTFVAFEFAVQIFDSKVLVPHKAAAVVAVVKPDNGRISTSSRLQAVRLYIETDSTLTEDFKKTPVFSSFQDPCEVFSIPDAKFN